MKAVSPKAYEKIEDAGAFVRTQMKKRIHTIIVGYVFPADGNLTEMYLNAISSTMSMALAHTGGPTEGDYLRWQYGGYGYSAYSVDTEGDYKVVYIQYDMDYYTTLEQEQQLDDAVSSFLSAYNLEEMSDRDKVKTIYEYITSHVTYQDIDQEGDFLPYTAYGAMVQGKAVCQGFSNLFYRLALEAGIDAREITGTGITRSGKVVRHGWNIVKLGSSYYYMDSTWDAGCYSDSFSFFLKNENEFERHQASNGINPDTGVYDPDIDFTSDRFKEAYPIAEVSYDDKSI